MYKSGKLKEERIWRKVLHIDRCCKDIKVNLNTLDSARSLEIFKSKIKYKGYGAVTKLQLKKGWRWSWSQCKLKKKNSPGHVMFLMKIVSDSDLFVWKPLCKYLWHSSSKLECLWSDVQLSYWAALHFKFLTPLSSIPSISKHWVK